MTLREVGEELTLTGEAVRIIELRALVILDHAPTAAHVKKIERWIVQTERSTGRDSERPIKTKGDLMVFGIQGQKKVAARFTDHLKISHL